MAKEMNKRIIRGRIDQLDENQKKRAVKLNDDYYIVYPMDVAENMSSLKQSLRDESKSTQERERDAARNELKGDAAENDFVKRNTSTDKFVVKGTSVLSKDWRLFAKASPEMEWVRKSLAILNNILDESIKDYVSANGAFDSTKYLDRVNTAYNEFFEAAQNYLDSRNPSSPPGIRRKNQVAALLNNAKKQKLDINNMIDAIKDGAVDFTTMSEEQLGAINSHNMVNQIEAREADGEVEWQNEGNSTDVYKLQLKSKDGLNDGQNYYLKENLPFLNENMEGFLTRRSRQLTVSQENAIFHKENPEYAGKDRPVEERIKDITADDYKFGVRMLDQLKNEINKASEADKGKVSQRIAGYFAHNFDEIFKEMELYNKAADFKPEKASMTIDQLIAEAERNRDNMLVEALKYRRKVMKAEGTYDANAKAGEALSKVTAAEWLTKKMKLNKKTDKVFLDALKGMTDKQVETLFRVTMGKEVELFGQMSAVKVQNGEEKAAINNTATSRLAEFMGFDDVITKSKTSMVKFQRRDGVTVNQLCTISEEAPGTELIDLMKEAERTGKKIIYSPEAMRGLMRLQAIDTLCLQKDRHGRNFKCTVDRDKNGNIIIQSIKAYDNDMSFDAVDLKTAFTDPETGEYRKYQFLPSMTMKVKPGTALYKHILGTYCGVDVVSPFKDVPETPNINWGHGVQQQMRGSQIERSMKFAWDKKGRKIPEYEDFFMDYNGESFDKNFKPYDTVTEEKKQEMLQDGKNLGLDKLYLKKVGKNPSIDTLCKHYAVAKMAYLSSEIKKIWARSPEEEKKYIEDYKAAHPEERYGPAYLDRTLKEKLTPEEKLRLSNLVEQLDDLDKCFNFETLKKLDMDDNFSPYVDVFVKSCVFLFKTTYGDSLEMRMLHQAKDYNALKSLMDKSGNIEIPSLLHYDNEAYLSLKASVAELKNPNSLRVIKLKETGLSDEKIAALAARNEEQLKMIKEAQIKAEQFYKAAGWVADPNKPETLNDPRHSFFLNKEDYKKLNSLTDLAIDPGNTYLAVDNENYLAGQTFMMNVNGKQKKVEYTQLMSEEEKEKARNYNEYILNDEKRWKYSAQEKSQNIKKYNVANTMDTSASTVNSAEYVRCCIIDTVYGITHEVIQNQQDLAARVKDALFLTGLKNAISSADVGGLSREGIDNMMKLGSDSRNKFDASFKTPAGKLFRKQFERSIAELYDGEKYKKFSVNKLSKMNELCVQNAMDELFGKLAKNELEVVDVIDQAKKLAEFGQNLGVKVTAEKAFDNYLGKKPDAISAEAKNHLTEAFKPQPKAQPAKNEVKNEIKNEIKNPAMN